MAVLPSIRRCYQNRDGNINNARSAGNDLGRVEPTCGAVVPTCAAVFPLRGQWSSKLAEKSTALFLSRAMVVVNVALQLNQPLLIQMVSTSVTITLKAA